MSREQEIVQLVDDAAQLAKRFHKLLAVDPHLFRQVLNAKAQPEIRGIVDAALVDRPLIRRVVNNRFFDDVDLAVERAIDKALARLEA